MPVDLFYFSGTGNSLHIARELQKRLPQTRIIPIAALLGRRMVKTDADTVGFVFPVYFMTLPAPVRHFCEIVSFDSEAYTFSIATRLGTYSVANLNVERILKKKGHTLHARLTLTMAKNTPTGLAPGKGDRKWIEKISPENISRLEKRVQTNLDMVQDIVLSKQRYPSKSFPNPFSRLLERIMDSLTRNMREQVGYYADSTCIKCGTCAKVCPSTTCRMHEGRPVWHPEVGCFYCFACFNFCPVQAILIKEKYTRKDGRYHHPSVRAEDIAAQKMTKQ